MSFRNRYIIAGANGPCSLSIPVAGGREQKVLIKDIQVDYSGNWNIKHWRTISSSYANSPFFAYYEDAVRNILLSKDKFLFDLNLKILSWLIKVLNIKVLVEFTEQFSLIYLNEDDYRGKLLPKNFQNERDNWKPLYPQVFGDRMPFQPNLSILDLLFCEGPNAGKLLNQSI
jgi:hypothetical protein